MPDVRTALALTTWTASLPRAVLVALIIGCATAPLALLVPIQLLVAAAAALAVIVAVSLHRPLAAYLLITFTPLLAGLERSSLIPLLRPHELLAVLLGTGLVVNGVGRLLSGQVKRPRLRAMDSAIFFMAFTGSVLPLLWLLARGQALTADDVLYALTFWKFYAVFLIVRLTVAEARQVRRCLVLSMATGCIVALVAGLQALQLLGIDDLVSQLYPPEDPSGNTAGRGSSTLTPLLLSATSWRTTSRSPSRSCSVNRRDAASWSAGRRVLPRWTGVGSILGSHRHCGFNHHRGGPHRPAAPGRPHCASGKSFGCGPASTCDQRAVEWLR